MIELSRAQDEEVGDGTTSVIVLGTYGFSLLLFFVCVFCVAFLPVLLFFFPGFHPSPSAADL